VPATSRLMRTTALGQRAILLWPPRTRHPSALAGNVRLESEQPLPRSARWRTANWARALAPAARHSLRCSRVAPLSPIRLQARHRWTRTRRFKSAKQLFDEVDESANPGNSADAGPIEHVTGGRKDDCQSLSTGTRQPLPTASALPKSPTRQTPIPATPSSSAAKMCALPVISWPRTITASRSSPRSNSQRSIVESRAFRNKRQLWSPRSAGR